MPIDSATIHTAVVLRRSRSGERSAQGSYDLVETASPPFAARLMLPPPVKPGRQAGGQTGDTAMETVTRYEWLALMFALDGSPVVIVESDRLFFTDAGPLGTPTIEVATKPELLNDGRMAIGWYGFANLVEDAANG